MKAEDQKPGNLTGRENEARKAPAGTVVSQPNESSSKLK